MSGAQPPVFATLEAQDRQLHGRAGRTGFFGDN
jgi:hypothetical protein